MEKVKSQCHPEKTAHAKGLCINCYHKKLWKEGRLTKKKNTTKAKCHPEKIVKGDGLCTSCYWKKWKDKNRERLKGYKRKSLLKATYGMTLDEYNERLKRQNYGCAICGESNGSRVMFVDHDHETGKVRGLLCVRCNSAIGLFYDDIKKLAKAIEYITSNIQKR